MTHLPRYRGFLRPLALAALAVVFAGTALAQHSAIKPEPRPDDWWRQRHESMNERVKQGNVDLVFIGDSITQSWENEGKDVWKKCYGERKAANLGIGGDRTQHVLWRLTHGNLDGIEPKAAVIMIGTNNSNGADNTAEEIAEGIAAIVKTVHEQCPETQILILGIFPRGPKPDAQREKNAAASAIAAKLADGKSVFYLDIGEKFLEKDGTLTKEIMPDFLHLSPRGYEIWAQAIEPKLKEMLKE